MHGDVHAMLTSMVGSAREAPGGTRRNQTRIAAGQVFFIPSGLGNPNFPKPKGILTLKYALAKPVNPKGDPPLPLDHAYERVIKLKLSDPPLPLDWLDHAYERVIKLKLSDPPLPLPLEFLTMRKGL